MLRSLSSCVRRHSPKGITRTYKYGTFAPLNRSCSIKLPFQSIYRDFTTTSPLPPLSQIFKSNGTGIYFLFFSYIFTLMNLIFMIK